MRPWRRQREFCEKQCPGFRGLYSSGISFSETYAEMGFRSQVYGDIGLDLDAAVDRRLRRFMGDGAAYGYVAMQEAIAEAGLHQSDISNERTGLIVGSGGPSTSNQVTAADVARLKGARRVGPYMVPRCMSSTVSANLATAFGIEGVSYSISSACSTSAHCIGHGFEQIQFGRQDLVFAGGCEEIHWSLSVLFDGMGALSSKYNDTPERASRPYDRDRDGFVISGGAGIVVLEALDHALARGARIYAELVRYAATTDGVSIVVPSGQGAVRAMRGALAGAGDVRVDYINAHGTSTPAGDITELAAVREVFGAQLPAIGSTKSLTGHAQGAAGAHEVIYSLLMMRHGFLAASANIDAIDREAAGFPIVRRPVDDIHLNCVMSNSFGFGGTNASLVFLRYEA